jgi:hypothetical protein
MDWQNQHSNNGFTIKNNLHVQCNSHQNHNDNFHRDLKINPKVHLETQKTMNSQGNIEQKEQCWRCHNTWFQTILQSHSNKISMVLAQKIYEDQWNRIDYLDMNLHTYNHLLFDKGAKNIRWRKDSLFKKWCWEKLLCTCRKLKLDACMSPLLVSTQSELKTLKLVPKRAENTLETIV